MLSIAPGTLDSYASALTVYSAHCASKGIPSASATGIGDYILHCHNSGDSYGRANSAYSALVFWAKLEGIDLQLPQITLMALKAFKRLYKHSRPVLWVTIQDLKRLVHFWQEVQLPYWTLLVLSFFTLIRPIEILNIKWKQIFFPEKYIYLPWSKNDPDGEGTYVKLLPWALEVLTRLRESLPRPPAPTDIVFPLPATSLNPWLKSQCQKAGVGPFTWYHLKHGGATYFALCGWKFADIKAHGRWKSDQSARVYIHAPVLL